MSKVENIIQSGLDKIPGYKGYKDKESRRDADKQVREAVADALTRQIDILTRYNGELSAQRDFEGLAAIEPAIGQIRLLADRVRTASYGYGGIFSDNSIDESALEQLRLFDSAMLREVDALASHVSKLTSSTSPDNDARSGMLDEINRLSDIFDRRGSVVQNGKPSEDEATMELLAIPEVIEPSPLLQLKKGDALSVLGDNYITNGIISIKTDDGNILLARVSNESEGATWLLGSSVSGMNSARVTEEAAGDGGFQTMLPGTASIDTGQGQEEGVPARYAYRDLGDNRVEFTLAFGDTIKVFSGSTVVDKDVEVYGVA